MTIIPEVRNELYELAARRAQPRSRGPISRLRVAGYMPWPIPVGAVALTVSTVCVVVVAGLALSSLGHRGAEGDRSSRAPGTSLAALQAQVALLRRPQSARDRTFPSRARVRGIIPDTVRLARDIDTTGLGPFSIYVFAVHGFARTQHTSRSTVLMSAEVADHGRVVGYGPFVGGARLGGPGNAVDPDLLYPGSHPRGVASSTSVITSVVPDGVARVRWTFSGAGVGIAHPHRVTINVPVINNVAARQLQPRLGPLVRVAWLDTRNHQIADAANPPGEATEREINAFNASAHNPVASVFRAHFALFRTVAPVTPAQLTGLLPQTGAGVAGAKLNWTQTRYIASATGLDGPGLWITPGSNGWLIGDSKAGASNTLANGLHNYGFLGAGTSNGRETTLPGVVPDGNRTVTLVLANGQHRVVPVVHKNVFEVTVPGQVIAIIDRGLDGRTARHNLR